MRSLMWFRADLRLDDNLALHHATRDATRGCVALYVLSPGDWKRHDTAPVRVEFTLRALRALSASLAALNIPLKIVTASGHADVARIVARVAREVEADAVFANREYEVNESRRDAEAERLLALDGRRWHAFDDQVVLAPGSVLTQSSTAYTVFTPFKKAWIRQVVESGGVALMPAIRRMASMPSVGARAIKPDAVPERVEGFVSEVPPELWAADEDSARARLDAFIRARLHAYKDERDFPALDATSGLSTYLATGLISPRRCVHAAATANNGKLDAGSAGAVHWISELVWREFYKHIVFHFPHVCMGRAFKPETERIVWSDDEAHFRAWCDGRTGVPLVDAALRALRATGWMHNRLRMVAAMYLSKDLFLDWRRGERHFMQQLVDGDLASNNGGWQWSASTGTDAAPYFRIFNPFAQSKRFDPTGAFIRRWVPELRDVPDASIHNPHDEKEGLPPLARMKLDYPRPIVDHHVARNRVLAAFKVI
jgi:deoxyribodipyrimidine photo-lyase